MIRMQKLEIEEENLAPLEIDTVQDFLRKKKKKKKKIS